MTQDLRKYPHEIDRTATKHVKVAVQEFLQCRRHQSLPHIKLHQIQPINSEAVKYLNRLSDLLFVLCRHVNDNGRKDVLWVPGKSRP